MSNTDNITNITTPSFASTAKAGSMVTLLDGATVIGTGVAAGGTWSITAATLVDETHSISVEATDLAGNISTAPAASSVTINTGRYVRHRKAILEPDYPQRGLIDIDLVAPQPYRLADS